MLVRLWVIVVLPARSQLYSDARNSCCTIYASFMAHRNHRPGRDRQWGLVLKCYGSNPSGIVLPASLRRYCIDILWCSINTRKCSLTRRESIRRWMLLEDFLRFFEDWTGRTSAVINTTCIDCEQVSFFISEAIVFSLPACLLQWWWMFCLCTRLTFAFRNPDGFYCNAIRGSS